MRTAPAPSRDMASATAVLAALLLVTALGADVGAFALAEGAGAAVAGGAAVALALRASFAARLVAGLVAGPCLVMSLLVMTVGPPGAGGGHTTVLGVVLVLVSAVVGLVVLRGPHTAAAGHGLPPYAP